MVMESTFEKRCQNVAPPNELSFMTASIATAFILTNIPGNILIFFAVVLDPNKNLRTPFNWLIINLSAADFIVGIITEPLSVYYHIKEGLNKDDPVEKIISHMTYFISCTASILSLTSLAFERYLAVRRPNTYRNKVTNKRILLTIAMIWLISLGLPNIYLIVGFTAYAFIFCNTFIVIAVIIICITYTLMKRKLKSRSKRISVTPSTSSDAKQTSPNEGMSTLSKDGFETKKQLLEAKITQMFLIVLIALLCCYGPSTVMMYLVNFCQGCSCTSLHWFRDIHILFALMNSSVNFFCYALRSARFRSAFVKLLQIKYRGVDGI
ncbi:5-hydroxytryptamine receptor 1B-like [Dendronephthya gigantea]|uniref:5-hydroxytryptamine receptor 1B-like n=1 Tax=Dendronephthya gigantea TaxID=151771 RepID=UPI00106C09B5|nr:5-hydroxytryptamine receptor 1B-like [Dendronephthya gigantea]